METDVYKIDVAYPVFGIPQIDSHTKSIVQKAVMDFKNNPPNPTPVAAKNEMIGMYGDVYSDEDIISAKMEIYQFTGGAHGGTVTYGLSFDQKAGTLLTLDDALTLTGMSLGQISEAAKKQLTMRFGMVQFPEGAAPTPENYSTFIVSKDAVTFIFQQYQVEAYAYGMPEISIPRVK